MYILPISRDNIRLGSVLAENSLLLCVSNNFSRSRSLYDSSSLISLQEEQNKPIR